MYHKIYIIYKKYIFPFSINKSEENVYITNIRTENKRGVTMP